MVPSATSVDADAATTAATGLQKRLAKPSLTLRSITYTVARPIA
jgi:hypothetical protein